MYSILRRASSLLPSSFAGHGPVLPGRVENLPPPELVLEIAVHFLGVGEEQGVRALFVDGHVKTGALLLGQLVAQIGHGLEIFLLRDGQVVAGLQVVEHALVQGARHLIAGPQPLELAHERGDVDAAGTGPGAPAAARAQPREVRGHDLLHQSVGQHAHDLARVQAAQARRASGRADVGAGAADQTVGEVVVGQEFQFVAGHGSLHRDFLARYEILWSKGREKPGPPQRKIPPT